MLNYCTSTNDGVNKQSLLLRTPLWANLNKTLLFEQKID